jgi:hypothetical protein
LVDYGDDDSTGIESTQVLSCSSYYKLIKLYICIYICIYIYIYILILYSMLSGYEANYTDKSEEKFEERSGHWKKRRIGEEVQARRVE